MTALKSNGHICFRGEQEYFWVTEKSGRKIVMEAQLDQNLDPISNQRVGARFRGTETWYFREYNRFLSINLDSKNEVNIYKVSEAETDYIVNIRFSNAYSLPRMNSASIHSKSSNDVCTFLSLSLQGAPHGPLKQMSYPK